MTAVIGHLEIPARDPERLAHFLRTVFGWRVEKVEWQGPAYQKIRTAGSSSRGDLQGGLIEAAGAGFEHPLPVIHLEEGEIGECLARIEAAGGAVVEPPRAIGDMGVFARFHDPDGHQWGLWTAARR